MANTYSLISTVTVGAGGTSSISFTDIPQIYKDLQLSYSGRSTSTGADTALSFNDITVSYSYTVLFKDGTSSGNSQSSSSSGFGGNYNSSAFTANQFASSSIYIANYGSSNFKTYIVDAVQENNGACALCWQAFNWSNTSPITKISLNPSSGNWVQHSTFYLYGILNS